MPRSSLCASGTQAVVSSHLRSVTGLLHGPHPPPSHPPLEPFPHLLLSPPHPLLVPPPSHPRNAHPCSHCLLPTPLLSLLFAGRALTQSCGLSLPVCPVVSDVGGCCALSTPAAADSGAEFVQGEQHDRHVLCACHAAPLHASTQQGLVELCGCCLLLSHPWCWGTSGGPPRQSPGVCLSAAAAKSCIVVGLSLNAVQIKKDTQNIMKTGQDRFM